jgi:hypothetical protein
MEMNMKQSLALSTLALMTTTTFAASNYQKEVPFKIAGHMTHFYGGTKAAEAQLWDNALQICKVLSENENNGLILNRLSEVFYLRGRFSSSATATFVCLPAGSAN